MNDSGRTVWLVTGAAGALGRAMAHRIMADEGELIALDRQAEALDSLHDELEQRFGRAPALMPMDLAGAGPDDYQRLAEAIEAEFGRLDVLVHNAAAFGGLRPMLQQPPGEWLEIIQTSVTAAYMLSAVLAPLMAAKGSVVFVGDGHCLDNPGGWAAYGVAQAARRHMVRVLQAERSRSSPGVLEVEPGAFYSRLRTTAWPSDSPDNLPSVESAAERVLAAVRRGVQSDS